MCLGQVFYYTKDTVPFVPKWFNPIEGRLHALDDRLNKDHNEFSFLVQKLRPRRVLDHVWQPQIEITLSHYFHPQVEIKYN